MVGVGPGVGVAGWLEQLGGEHGESASKGTEGTPQPDADVVAQLFGHKMGWHESLTCGPRCQGHVNTLSADHIAGLKQVMENWTSCELISKFKNSNVHFKSLEPE